MAESNLMFGQSRKNLFEDMADERKCSNYQPCPVCFKCTHRAVHLFEKCDQCPIPICGHTQKDRAHLIRPKNFELGKTEALSEDIRRTYQEYLEKTGGKK